MELFLREDYLDTQLLEYDIAMPQLLGDMLSKRDYSEPPEVKLIKDFVKSELNFEVNVSIKANALIVHVPSAGAAGALRPKVFQLQKLVEGEKRIVVRIG